VLDWIAGRYSDLLSGEERGFIAAFATLPQSSRALLTRMVMRKGELFRATRLYYDEIGCPDAAAKPLADAGWITCNPPLTIAQLFGLLRKDEIVAAFRLSAAGKLSKKSELLEQLQHEFAEARPLTQWVSDTDELVYAVNVTSLCERLRLMFSAISIKTGRSSFCPTSAFTAMNRLSSRHPRAASVRARTSTTICTCTDAGTL